jgi:hypothetical protein
LSGLAGCCADRGHEARRGGHFAENGDVSGLAVRRDRDGTGYSQHSPGVIVLPALLVAVLIGITVSEPELTTYAVTGRVGLAA